MATVLTEPARRRMSTRFRIYVPIAVFTLVVAFVGFWANYYGRIFTGTVTTAPIIQFHAAIFIGWLLLVTTQAVLAARGRTALHMRVGNYVMAYGVVVVVVGVIATFAAFEMHSLAGNPQKARSQLFIGLTDIATFMPFLAAAWLYRRRPEVHKRLIIVATCTLLIAPVHRMSWFLGGPPPPLVPVLLIWMAPIYVGMLYDLITRRIVHPVYLVGIVAIVYMKFWRIPMYQSKTWDAFADWLHGFMRDPRILG